MKNKLSNLFSALIVLAVMLMLVLALFVAKPDKDEITKEALKREENNIYNFLLLGKDNAAGLCDVVILGTVNTSNGNICFMQIPRDTYFNGSEASYKKINGVRNSLGSAAAVSGALSNALGIKIDFYLCLGLDVVERMVDELSGIEIDVPIDMDYNDPEQNLSIHLKAGKQTLSGKQAVEFLRYRSGYVTGDLGRIDAQKLFLNSFAKKVSQIGNPMALYNLFKLVCDNSETNVRANDLISIGVKCIKAKHGKVSYLTAPGEAIQSESSGAWYYILSAPSMDEILRSHFDMNDGFDKENKFVDKNVKSFFEIYNKACEIKIYSADDIEGNKININ